MLIERQLYEAMYAMNRAIPDYWDEMTSVDLKTMSTLRDARDKWWEAMRLAGMDGWGPYLYPYEED